MSRRFNTSARPARSPHAARRRLVRIDAYGRRLPARWWERALHALGLIGTAR